jgi:hypothetical protein
MIKRLQKTKMKSHGQKVVFHGSVVPNLNVIEPSKVEKHDSPYVYVSENLPVCVVFAVKRTCEDVTFGLDIFGKPYIEEFYDGAFYDRFKNKKCYIYLLPKKDFSFETKNVIELVSKKPVKVLDCIEINDSAEFLFKQAKSRKIKICWYKDYSKKHKKKVEQKLYKALLQYANMKELSQGELDNLSSTDNNLYLSYCNKKIRKDNCYKKFPELMKKLEGKQ